MTLEQDQNASRQRNAATMVFELRHCDNNFGCTTRAVDSLANFERLEKGSIFSSAPPPCNVLSFQFICKYQAYRGGRPRPDVLILVAVDIILY